MRIITISREFGSGGRELGKRMADVLGFDYYDKEIITAIAAKSGMDENYVESALESNFWQQVPLTFNSSFEAVNLWQNPQTNLLVEQRKVIENIAKRGKDCIIVGRNADVLLADYNPMSIFVCADMDAKVRRCVERAKEGENLSRRAMEQNIRRIDKNRAQTREMVTGLRWGMGSAYDVTINTSGWELKKLAPVVAELALKWFENR